MPTDVMNPDDACELATVLRDRDQGIVQVISQIGPVGDRSISVALGRASRRPVLHNVFSVSELRPDLHRQSMDWLTQVNADGIEMYAATVVTRAWNEVELFESPGCALDALDVYRELTFRPTADEKRALLEDPDFRRRFNEAYDPVMFEATAGSIDKYVVISVGRGRHDVNGLIGKTLRQIAEERGISDVDAFIDLALETDLRVELRSPGVAEDPVKVADLLTHSHVLAGASDGGAHTKNWSGGQWCTDLLLWLNRENALYSLEEMHYRLSYQQARVMGLRDRGALLEGMAADVLIYDPSELYYDLERLDVLYDQPGGDFRRKARAGGYHLILVNGEVTFEKDVPTGANPGLFVSPPPLEDFIETRQAA
jgi:N-acyl-D-aspartate/D-glutamate deacylase